MGLVTNEEQEKLASYDERRDQSTCLLCYCVLKGNLLGTIRRHYVTDHYYTFDDEYAVQKTFTKPTLKRNFEDKGKESVYGRAIKRRFSETLPSQNKTWKVGDDILISDPHSLDLQPRTSANVVANSEDDQNLEEEDDKRSLLELSDQLYGDNERWLPTKVTTADATSQTETNYTNSRYENRDETGIENFFEGIIKTVKKLSKLNQCAAKNKIFNIVSTLEYRELSQKEVTKSQPAVASNIDNSDDFLVEMDELALIENVRKREFLYNKSLPEYRETQKRQAAWDQIGKELNLTGLQAKEAWDKLRRCFCNARQRRISNVRAGVNLQTQWRYEHQMSFLFPFLHGGKTQSNKADDDDNSQYELNSSNCSQNGECLRIKQEFNEDFIEDPLNEFGEPLNKLPRLENPLVDMETAERVSNTIQSMISDTSAIQRQETLVADVASATAKSNEVSYIRSDLPSNLAKNSSSNPFENFDETDLFFLSMSKMTKKLPKVEQARIKLALSNSVLSAEIKCCEKFADGNTTNSMI